jgi:hypothetical protein
MVAAVRRGALAVLGQKRALLQALTPTPTHYTAPCPLAGNATIGQHLRHSLDHYARCLAAAEAATATTIRYDRRARGTAVESDIGEAKQEVDRLIKAVKSLPDAALAAPVSAAFVLSSDGEGEEQPLASTLGRELGFVTHHAIHHHALIKTMAGALGLEEVAGIEDFGMAPSTAHYRRTAGAQQQGQ